MYRKYVCSDSGKIKVLSCNNDVYEETYIYIIIFHDLSMLKDREI